MSAFGDPREQPGRAASSECASQLVAIQPGQHRPNGVTFDKSLGFNCCHLM
jgi:hypothetical protein